MYLSGCIEMLFAGESEDFVERIHLAKAAGLEAIEFWRWSNKDLPAVEQALKDTGIRLEAILAEPMIAITDPANRDAFLKGLPDSIATAQRLGASTLIAQSGNELSGKTRAEQADALVETLKQAADLLKGTGVRIGLEPLNSLIDHPGYYLTSTKEGFELLDRIGRPEIGMTYDIYHSAVMDELTEDVVGDHLHHIVHVHIADHPGRGEPGSGGLDLRHRLDWLKAAGYDGAVGLEYRPTIATIDTLSAARDLIT